MALIKTSAEFVREFKPPKPRWGEWRLSGMYLEYPAYGPGKTYPINLDRFTSSSQMLDMIMQVAHKNWATDKCLAGLVRALNDILNPQSMLCSGGRDFRAPRTRIRARVREYRR
jgi:hypothetical protein